MIALVPESYWIEEMRRIVDGQLLRALRKRTPMMTLGESARACNLSVVRFSELERRVGDKVTEQELIKLHNGFMRPGRGG